MSVVVAIKENGKVYMGCDSQITKGNTRMTMSNKNNFKIWNVKNCDNCLMGGVGNTRDINIVKLFNHLVSDYDAYKGNVDFEFVVKSVVPDIVSALKEANYIKMDGEYLDSLDSMYLFAYKDSVYMINTDCAVIEIDDCVAIGSGKCEAIGSLLSSEGKSPKERIIMAIKASAANDIYVDYPIIISDTETTTFDIVTEKNEKNFMK